jgi:hypothetical protein
MVGPVVDSHASAPRQDDIDPSLGKMSGNEYR